MTPANTQAGCIEWSGKRDKDGYGCLWLAGEQRAHRALYRLYCGPIPAGMQVLHSCDNPPCVNLDHLRIGTVADNMADRKARGRGVAGPSHPNAKLSAAAVLAIRNGLSRDEAIAQFHIGKSSFYRVRAHESYSGVTGK